MKSLIPDTIAARTLLVLILGLALTHAISVTLYMTDRNNAQMFSDGENISQRIAAVDRLIENSPTAERARLVELANDSSMRVTWGAQSAIGSDSEQRGGVLLDTLRARLSPDGAPAIRLRHMGMAALDPAPADVAPAAHGAGEVETVMVSLPLPDGSWLNFTASIAAPEPFWSIRFGLSMIVMLSAVVLLSAVVVQHLTRPLATFAHAAQRLGVDVEAPSLPEKGPAEVRQATSAFNEMQHRIRRFVEDRTQMIAAISHDLGTPITRLRLRTEFVEDAEQQRKMLADLDDMEKMVFSALSFARDESGQEPRATLDLRTLLQRVCDDTGDAGYVVTLTCGDAAMPYDCRPVALRRAVSNLVENAVKYGQQAAVSLVEDLDVFLVTIEDEGPGIPEDRREDVFKPFHRIDESRNRETGGTGLGLTVARTIIRAHGGDIQLCNRTTGGLRVEVRLPR